MENLLLKYMEDRLKESMNEPLIKRHDPVLTISREAGCPGNLIAQKVLQLIHEHSLQEKTNQWKIVNKEIVTESARKLSLTPDKISYVFKAEDRQWLDEMIFAMSNRYHKSDVKIRKAIINVIQSFIDGGYLLLVGRGGVVFTQSHPKALNVYLLAPPAWRLDRIKEFMNLPADKALEYMQTTDHDRRGLVNGFYGSETDSTIYDVIFNCARLDIDQVATEIFNLMKMKKMFEEGQ